MCPHSIMFPSVTTASHCYPPTPQDKHVWDCPRISKCESWAWRGKGQLLHRPGLLDRRPHPLNLVLILALHLKAQILDQLAVCKVHIQGRDQKGVIESLIFLEIHSISQSVRGGFLELIWEKNLAPGIRTSLSVCYWCSHLQVSGWVGNSFKLP